MVSAFRSSRRVPGTKNDIEKEKVAENMIARGIDRVLHFFCRKIDSFDFQVSNVPVVQSQDRKKTGTFLEKLWFCFLVRENHIENWLKKTKQYKTKRIPTGNGIQFHVMQFCTIAAKLWVETKNREKKNWAKT